MNIVFNTQDLKDLYEKGISKKLKLEESIKSQYVKTVDALYAADKLEDLYQRKSLNFEHLSGSDMYSVRINKQYRLEFTIQKDKENNLIISVTLIRISKHYE